MRLLLEIRLIFLILFGFL